ncbi:MAG: DUF1109 domain-containing protein [Hyphomicrobiaceae bacterium]|nr:DUF1109 domain-containing protein [Hyphomicrobiaceae bacterium]
MKTDDLIKALAADLPTKPTPVGRGLWLAIAASLPVLATMLLAFAPPRPGLLGMLGDVKVLLKFAFTLGLFAAGVWLAVRITRPGVGAGPAKYALLAAFTMLGAGVASELWMLPTSAWYAVTLGKFAVPCVTLIMLFSAAPLAALMYALRSGAPDSPALAGAVAGLVAGSLAAAFYATHCVEDSALFLSVWYVIGISAVTIVGALIGRQSLRW